MKAAKIELARQDVSRRTPQERVVHHWGLARKHIALLAEDVWRCGAALNEVKAVLSHGDFGRWLQSVEIPDRTARHWMRFAREVQIGNVADFTSVSAALKAIPKPPPEPKAESEEPKQLTTQEKWLVERDDLVKENRQLKVELQDADNIAAEKKQLVEHYESELKVDKGFAKGRDVLEERQEEIRKLKYRVYELEEENGSLLRELKKLKNPLRQRNRATAV